MSLRKTSLSLEMLHATLQFLGEKSRPQHVVYEIKDFSPHAKFHASERMSPLHKLCSSFMSLAPLKCKVFCFEIIQFRVDVVLVV
jgi:hypothetical protein